MKNARVLFLVAFAMTISVAYGQTNVGEAESTKVGLETAKQKLKEVSVSKFEDASFWNAYMAPDMGYITARRFEGAPSAKKPIEDEKTTGTAEADEYVLGVRVDFLKRYGNSFSISAIKPLAIEGICKTVSVWVIGRNYNHVLKLVIQDYYGQRKEIVVGKLNFAGWKKLTVAIPPSIAQRDYHYNNKMGIKILGFVVDCDIEESYGSYYLYLDDLRAVTDLFAETYRDPDDMADSW